MRKLAFAFALLILAIPCQARIITVDDDGPADFNNIQAGINDANDGDTVEVQLGTYTGPGNRDIDFLGKAITVKSENGPENCIIDCNGTEDDEHRGFYFHSGEDSNSVVDGFTIVNGCHWVGGAIFSDGSSPIITNCIIRNNEAVVGGGGICFFYGSPIVRNCTFLGNSAEVGGAIGSGGNDLEVINCDIRDNSADTGGGIVLWGDSNPILSHCTLTGNSAWEGGAISSWDSSPMITNCIITGNTAVGWGYGGGGIVSHISNLTIYNCTISNNLAGGYYPYGGGISCESHDNFVLTNCILWGNEATDGQEIYLRHNSNAWLSYTDVQDSQEDIHVGSNCTLDWDAGNINADPCFIEPGAGYLDDNNTPDYYEDDIWVWEEGDYHLLENSPCIDAGDPNYVAGPNETDLDGNPRIVDGDNDGNSVVDMGSYEYRPPTPAELVAELLEEVGGLELPRGIENGLEAKLEAALRALEDENENNDAAAINTLEGFINAVEAQRGKKIPEAEADALIAAAQEIIELLSDS